MALNEKFITHATHGSLKQSLYAEVELLMRILK